MVPDLRKQQVLAAIVENYIAYGEPIGSKSLMNLPELSVSSATIRNDMAELSEQGLIEQPHTSAGRIPSQRGYRYYVDSLMGNREISYEDKALIDEALLIAKGDPERVLIEATKVLSALSGLAAVATTSPGNDARIHKIKFISVSRYISMLILITSTGIVKNKLFHCDYVLTTEILNVFEIALNEKLSGFPLKDITPAFIQTTAISLSDLALLLPNVLAALMEAAKEAAKTFFALEGQMNLLFLNEDFDILNAKNAIRFLLSGDEITALLLSRPNKTAVLIGGEIGNPLLSNISIVSARYMISDQVAGSLAIIGPTRMDYAKATTVIKYTSDSVSDIITELINI